MKTIFQVALVILLLFLGYQLASQILSFKGKLFSGVFEHSGKIKLPVIIEIDTVRTKTVVTVTQKDTIYLPAKIDSNSVTTKYFPDNPYIAGYLHITYRLRTKDYLIFDNLEVHHQIITETVTVTQEVEKPRQLFRPSAIGGYLYSKDESIISLGIGLTIKDRLSFYLTGLSNKSIGGQVAYDF